MDQKPFRQRTIDEFLDDLGSSAPAREAAQQPGSSVRRHALWLKWYAT